MVGVEYAQSVRGSTPMDSPNFTVIICTKDRRADLGRCLDSLSRQFLQDNPESGITTGRWKVLVVDNASSDGCDEEVSKRSRDYPVALSCVREPQAGLSIARNRGLQEADTDIVIFVDDDVSFHSQWRQAWEVAFIDQSVVAAGGPVIPVFPEQVPDWYIAGVMADGGTTTGNYQPGETAATITAGGPIGHPRGGNMAIRRTLALSVGGFREDLGWGKKRIPAEETEFFKRVHGDGGLVLYLPPAKVNHHLDKSRLNIKYLRKWHLGYGRASILMRPPPTPVHWVLKFLEQVFNLLIYSLRLMLPGGLRNFRAHRKQRQSMGRLAQMLGL